VVVGCVVGGCWLDGCGGVVDVCAVCGGLGVVVGGVCVGGDG
jgi:hypothetical protein